ncbi:MAG: GDYXXLXY domain-containing protein [Candidatus Omnitrophota bacterium]
MLKKKACFILGIIFIALALTGAIYYWFEIKPVAIVLIKTDIDPSVAMRGKIIALDYEISKIPFSLLRDAHPEDIQAGWHNNDIYVALEKEGKYWRAVRAYRKAPMQKNLVSIWGKCNSKLNNTFYVRYNIELLRLSDKTAQAVKELWRKKNSLDMIIGVEISINCQGKARIRRIFINDLSIKV